MARDHRVIVSVAGGNVAIVGGKDIPVIVIDWDNIHEDVDDAVMAVKEIMEHLVLKEVVELAEYAYQLLVKQE